MHARRKHIGLFRKQCFAASGSTGGRCHYPHACISHWDNEKSFPFVLRLEIKVPDQSLRHACYDFLQNYHIIFSTKQSPSLKLPVIPKIILRTRIVFFFYHIFPIISNIFIICLLTMNLPSQLHCIPIYCRENFLPTCVSNYCIVREQCSGLPNKFHTWMDSHTGENARITYTLFISALTFFRKLFTFQIAFFEKLSHFSVLTLKMSLRMFFDIWYANFFYNS